MSATKNAKPDVQQLIAELKTSKGMEHLREARAVAAVRRMGGARGRDSGGEDELQADAIKQSSATQTAFKQQIDGLRNVFGTLRLEVAPPRYVILDTPILTWATPGIELLGSNNSPYESYARMQMYAGPQETGAPAVQFYFLWENSSSQEAAVNILSYIMFNGWISAQGGTTSQGAYLNTSLSLQASLHVYGWWQGKLTEPLSQAGQIQEVASVHAMAVETGNVPKYDFEKVSKSADPSYSFFSVPPNNIALIEVDAVFAYNTGGGHVKANFESGSSGIICPSVVLVGQFGS